MLNLFIAMTIGSVSGVFYPSLVGAFRKNRPVYRLLSGRSSQTARILIFLGAGLLIGVILSLITFGAFLGNAASQKELLALGATAWVLSFAAGFAASSAAEELTRGSTLEGAPQAENAPRAL